MVEIFISYKSERRKAAEHLAQILRCYGYSVWFDYSLIKGRDFGLQIDAKVREAKAVVVLWCAKSVGSRWVAEEADLAQTLGSLLPVRSEDCDLPVGFRRLDYIDLTGWDGAPRTHVLDKLLDELEQKTGRAPNLDLKAMRAYEETWRRFGAPSLKDFALDKEIPEGDRKMPEPKAPLVVSGRNGVNGLLIAAQEWPAVRESRDITRLKRFEAFFAGTFYAVEAQALREALEAEVVRLEQQARAAKTKEVHVEEGHEDGDLMVTEGQYFTVHAKAGVHPTIQPKDYEGLQLVREVADVTGDVINSALSRLQQQLRTYYKKNGPAAPGDRVTLNGQGYTLENGQEKAFEGGKLDCFPVVIGSNMLIPGFEDGLIGAKGGDKLDLELTFPADYHSKFLAGKPACFKLAIVQVEEGKEEPFNDESVKPLGFESVEKLKEVLRQAATRDLKAASDQRLKRQLLDKLDEKNLFDLPRELVDKELAVLWRAQLQELQMRRLPLAALGKPAEEAKAELRPLAERRVRLGLLMIEIARIQKIIVIDADLDAAVRQQVEKNGSRSENELARPEKRQQLARVALEDKVSEWLYSKATITEKKVEAADLLPELQ
jgi:trigger factor